MVFLRIIPVCIFSGCMNWIFADCTILSAVVCNADAVPPKPSTNYDRTLSTNLIMPRGSSCLMKKPAPPCSSGPHRFNASRRSLHNLTHPAPNGQQFPISFTSVEDSMPQTHPLEFSGSNAPAIGPKLLDPKVSSSPTYSCHFLKQRLWLAYRQHCFWFLQIVPTSSESLQQGGCLCLAFGHWWHPGY